MSGISGTGKRDDIKGLPRVKHFGVDFLNK